MWQKFGAGIWEALAKRYPDIDMNEVRGSLLAKICALQVPCGFSAHLRLSLPLPHRWFFACSTLLLETTRRQHLWRLPVTHSRRQCTPALQRPPRRPPPPQSLLWPPRATSVPQVCRSTCSWRGCEGSTWPSTRRRSTRCVWSAHCRPFFVHAAPCIPFLSPSPSPRVDDASRTPFKRIMFAATLLLCPACVCARWT